MSARQRTEAPETTRQERADHTRQQPAHPARRPTRPRCAHSPASRARAPTNTGRVPARRQPRAAAGPLALRHWHPTRSRTASASAEAPPAPPAHPPTRRRPPAHQRRRDPPAAGSLRWPGCAARPRRRVRADPPQSGSAATPAACQSGNAPCRGKARHPQFSGVPRERSFAREGSGACPSCRAGWPTPP